MNILLASQSPRRQQLLAQLGVSVQTVSPDIDETPLIDELPYQYVERMGLAKAERGFQLTSSVLPIIGSDTTVCIDDELLSKPEDEQDGCQMLARLSGRQHQVMTSVSLLHKGSCQTRVCVSDVWFKTLTEQEIITYWKTGEPADKAGSYAIQGIAGQFITRLEGSYSGVMGLPLYETASLLKSIRD